MWKYTALGDSNARGYGAFKGYVPRYRDYIGADVGVSVTVNNLGVPARTSTRLAKALTNPTDPYFQTFQDALKGADVVTWDIGGVDLIFARALYTYRLCGGADNQDCLRTAVGKFKTNWDAIIAALLGLRSTDTTIIRTMDIYNPYVAIDKGTDTWQNDGGLNDFQAFKPYLDEINAYISTTATEHGIPYARLYVAFNGPNGDVDPADRGLVSWDGVHPNDTGHKLIADLLRDLQYAPLR